MSDKTIIPIGDVIRHHRMRVFDYAAHARKKVAEKIGREPICGRGCAWCCNTKVVMDAGHGAMVALYLEQTGRWTPALAATLAEADAAMSRASHADWMGRRRPCALLDVRTGACTVYPVRPIGCYAVLSQASDGRECGEVGGKVLAMVQPDYDVMRHMVELPEAILRGAGETLAWLMTLPGAVLYGHALLMGEPKPPVFRVPKEEWEALPEPRPDLEAWFDALATAAAQP